MKVNKIFDRIFSKSLLPFIILITIVLLFGIVSPVFLSPMSIRNLLMASPQVCLITIGMALLLIAGEIDLSVGSIFVVSTSTMAALYAKYNVNIFLASLITLTIGACLGLLNGFITTKTKLNSFIVTLGTMWAYRGIMLSIIGGYSIPFYPKGNEQIVEDIFAGEVFGTPSQFVLLILASIFLWLLLGHTKFGNWVYATGSNREAAFKTGINIEVVKIVCFGMLGVLCSISGLIQLCRVNASVPQTGDFLMLMAVAGAVVGGVSLRGGRGTISNALIGAYIIQVISLGLVTLGIIEHYTNVAICILLILTAYVHSQLTSRGK